MKNSILTLVIILFGSLVNAQMESSNWYFGDFAGLSFSNGLPEANVNGALTTWEGCASISSYSGELLFYTDGNKIWNRNHVLMPNGSGLLGNLSSTQSALIVQKPENDSLYYLFTIDDVAHGNGGSEGLNYSIVNMNLESGLGDVIEEEKNNHLTSPMCEKVTATKHANGIDVWILCQKWETNDIYAYLLTAEGIDTEAVINSCGTIISGIIDNAKGYMKVSPNSSIIAKANAGMHTVEIFDFNNSTGGVTNARVIPDMAGEPYGIEFSPDNKLLYVNTWKNQSGQRLLQYDLEAGDINDIIASEYIVGIGTNGALQTAPDNKIYIAMNGSGSLSRINQPNKYGPDCDFEFNSISLGGKTSQYGLPNFPSYIIPPVGEHELVISTTDINIYPNPNNGRFYLEVDSSVENAVIELYDLNGKLIWKENVQLISNLKTNIIDVSFLDKTSYILLLKTGNKTFSTKLFIE
ncbi:MAG: hypothetical protein C0595_06450 [Marinilabiliales bacterium]|nr:MAG: hypothetical protein C0595_06450 [Marinilabiliales bacterium]